MIEQIHRKLNVTFQESFYIYTSAAILIKNFFGQGEDKSEKRGKKKNYVAK